MKKFFLLLLFSFLWGLNTDASQAQIEEVAINPYDWITERQRLEWALQAPIECTSQVCVVYVRLDSLVIISDLPGNTRMTKAIMRNADGSNGRVYIVSQFQDGTIEYLIGQQDIDPRSIDIPEINSPWWLFDYIFNLLTTQTP